MEPYGHTLCSSKQLSLLNLGFFTYIAVSPLSVNNTENLLIPSTCKSMDLQEIVTVPVLLLCTLFELNEKLALRSHIFLCLTFYVA